MERYCKIPVENMTNTDKVIAMVERINIMGSTHVWPEFGTFTMAFEERHVGLGDYMYLYDITSTGLVFCQMDKERMKKENTTKPLPLYGKMWRMPLNWFSEELMYSVFMTLKSVCKRSLTPNAYEEVLFEIGETPEEK